MAKTNEERFTDIETELSILKEKHNRLVEALRDLNLKRIEDFDDCEIEEQDYLDYEDNTEDDQDSEDEEPVLG